VNFIMIKLHVEIYMIIIDLILLIIIKFITQYHPNTKSFNNVFTDKIGKHDHSNIIGIFF
jgi:hypothetical protein